MISYPWDSIVEATGDDGFPIYDRDYKAADLQSLNGRIFSNGVFMDEPDAFVVTPADGMNVILSTGWCCINGTFGNEPNMRELAIQSSASTQDRIDTVVLRWNANIEMRNIDVYVKTGVASDVPVRPTLTRDSTVYELGIADIFVPRGSGAISAARITDTRLQTDRCGAVTPFVQIDTTTFFDQIQAAIDERTAELEEQTAKAVELAQSAIDGTTAGNLQSQIDANKEAIEENKATDDERWDSLSQAETVTVPLAAGWQSGTVSAKRHGGIVELTIRALSAGVITGINAVLCTLPEGFRPSTGVVKVIDVQDSLGSIGAGQLSIDVSGVVVNNSTMPDTRRVIGTVIYFAS